MSDEPKRFHLMGETHPGAILRIRRFATRAKAEKHAADRMSTKYWKAWWIEERDPTDAEKAPVTHAPPLPWIVEWNNRFTYVRDAEGARILTLYGSQERRMETERMLIEAGLVLTRR